MFAERVRRREINNAAMLEAAQRWPERFVPYVTMNRRSAATRS
jgi:hypothetical protein